MLKYECAALFCWTFGNILFQKGLSVSLPCEGTVTNADCSSCWEENSHVRFPLSNLWCNWCIRCRCEHTVTGVVSHNIGVEVVAPEKLLQALLGHGGLRSQSSF